MIFLSKNMHLVFGLLVLARLENTSVSLRVAVSDLTCKVRAASRSKIRCELREEPNSAASCELNLKLMRYL